MNHWPLIWESNSTLFVAQTCNRFQGSRLEAIVHCDFSSKKIYFHCLSTVIVCLTTIKELQGFVQIRPQFPNFTTSSQDKEVILWFKTNFDSLSHPRSVCGDFVICFLNLLWKGCFSKWSLPSCFWPGAHLHFSDAPKSISSSAFQQRPQNPSVYYSSIAISFIFTFFTFLRFSTL